jgi:hypothetical protein
MCRRIPSGDAAEDGAGHQAGAAGVVVVEKAADDFAGGERPGMGWPVSRTAVPIVNLKPAEAEGVPAATLGEGCAPLTGGPHPHTTLTHGI